MEFNLIKSVLNSISIIINKLKYKSIFVCIYLPYGFLARIACSASKGLDSPSAFTALTRNRYSLPGVNPVTSKAVKTDEDNTFTTIFLTLNV